MALVSSGLIQLGGSNPNRSIAQEINRSNLNGVISLNDTDVRNLAGISSGAISMSDFHNASFGVILDDYSTSITTSVVSQNWSQASMNTSGNTTGFTDSTVYNIEFFISQTTSVTFSFQINAGSSTQSFYPYIRTSGYNGLSGSAYGTGGTTASRTSTHFGTSANSSQTSTVISVIHVSRTANTPNWFSTSLIFGVQNTGSNGAPSLSSVDRFVTRDTS